MSRFFPVERTAEWVRPEIHVLPTALTTAERATGRPAADTDQVDRQGRGLEAVGRPIGRLS